MILKYNQSLESFYDATYRGKVSLQTKKGMNYYFTPLGKSYICVEDEDPLTLFNEDDEPVGNVTLFNIKVNCKFLLMQNWNSALLKNPPSDVDHY